MPYLLNPSRPRARTAVAGLALLALGVSAVAAGCGSTVDPGSTGAAGATSSSSASAQPVPDQDVVSGVRRDPGLAAQLPASVRSSGTLTLGTILSPGTAGLPHAGQVGGRDVGLDVDLRDAVARKLGIRWKVEHGTFDTIIPGVQNGKYAVGQANFGVTAEREKIVDFATYLQDGQSFLGAAKAPVTKVAGLTDLCGLRVATTPGSTFQQILTDGAAKCAAAGKKPYQVSYFATTAPIFLGLQNGKVDVYFGPTLSVKYDAQHIPGTRFLGQISSTPVGFVSDRGTPLARALSGAVNALIADGTYRRIFAKWDVTGTGVDRAQVNPEPTL